MSRKSLFNQFEIAFSPLTAYEFANNSKKFLIWFSPEKLLKKWWKEEINFNLLNLGKQ